MTERERGLNQQLQSKIAALETSARNLKQAENSEKELRGKNQQV
jgi:hypothetical protein